MTSTSMVMAWDFRIRNEEVRRNAGNLPMLLFHVQDCAWPRSRWRQIPVGESDRAAGELAGSVRDLVRWNRTILPTAPDAASIMFNSYLHFSSSFLLSLAFIVIITLLLPSPFLSLPLSYTRKLSDRSYAAASCRFHRACCFHLARTHSLQLHAALGQSLY